MSARIASVFVLLALSAAGSFFPIMATRFRALRMPLWVIFITKYFGSGVIVATAFIHLLGESQTSLSHECVGEIFQEYAWPSALSLAGTVVMFTIEIWTHRAMDRRQNSMWSAEQTGCGGDLCEMLEVTENAKGLDNTNAETQSIVNSATAHANDDVLKALLNIYLLEFGIVFHSVFVGLSLAIAGEQFPTLFVAISFHQFFEGMGLGGRFATAEWPEHLQNMPWYLSAVYSVTTPIGIAAGLGVRHLYSENSPESLIVVGVFDGFCSGLLIYNGLVELMSRDFLQSSTLRKASTLWFALAYAMFLSGAALMALVGKWA